MDSKPTAAAPRPATTDAISRDLPSENSDAGLADRRDLKKDRIDDLSQEVS